VTIIRELRALFGFDLNEASIRRADVALDRGRRNLAQYQRGVNGLNLGIGRMLATYAGAALVMGGGRGLFSANQQIDSLRARLELVTGSAEATEAALDFVREFAVRSPDQIGQIADAWITLQSQGLDPTVERLTALGDVAAATQVPISELLDAMSGGAIGNTERLDQTFRAFGLNFMSRNGRLFVSMNGQVREIGEGFGEIAAFVEDLGRTRFAGGMVRQSETLAGRMSMLQDAATAFAVSVGDAGATEAMRGLLDSFTSAIGDSDDLAHSIGTVLAGGLDTAADLVDYLRENTHMLRLGLIVLGAASTTGPILRGADALMEMNRAAVLVRLQALAVTGAVTAAVVGTVLLIDDFVAFMQGRPSVIGVLVGNHSEADGFMGNLARMFGDIREHGGAAWDLFLEDVEAVIDRAKELWRTVTSPVRWLMENLPELTAQMGDLIPEELVNAARTVADALERITELTHGMGPAGLAVNLLPESTQQTFDQMLIPNPASFLGISGRREFQGEDSGGTVADLLRWVGGTGPDRVDANGDPIGARAVGRERAAAQSRSSRTSVRVERLEVTVPASEDPGVFGRAVARAAAVTLEDLMLSYDRSTMEES